MTDKDAQYLAAVEAGDLNAVENLVNNAAKVAGYTIGPVYHGSSYSFDIFQGDSYFTDDFFDADGYASGEHVYEVYLKIQTPLIIDAKGKKWDDLESIYGTSTQEIVWNLDRDNYDGVIFLNIKDSWIDDADYQEPGTVWVTTNSNQVKSAAPVTYDSNGNLIPLSRRFNQLSNSIYESAKSFLRLFS